MSFKIGDKVKAFGVNGVVVEIRPDRVYPIIVKFETFERISFTGDGREFSWHKTPSLKLRKFKKREVPRVIWVNNYGGDGAYVYASKYVADRDSLKGRIGGKAWRYILAKKQG